MEELLASEDMRRANRLLDVWTADFHVKDQLAIKRAIIHNMLTRQFIATEHLRTTESVYICSRADVPYALLLGCRKITLVDEDFGDPMVVVEVLENTEKIVGRTVTPKLDGSLVFDFDFGDGPETVTIRCRAARYRESKHSAHDILLELLLPKRFERRNSMVEFKPDGPIGLLLGHCIMGVHLNDDPEVIDAILPGGFVLVNTPGECLSGKTLGGLLEEPDPGAGAYEQLMQMLQQCYERERRFEFVPLEGMPEPYTCLRKVA